MSADKEKWVQIEGGPYEINQAGIVRRTKKGGSYPKNFCLRAIKNRRHIGYCLVLNGTNRFYSIEYLMRKYHDGAEHLPKMKLDSIRIQRNQDLRDQNGNGRQRPQQYTAANRSYRNAPKKRKCATCGKSTDNYRCETCWARLRGDVDTNYDAAEYGAALSLGRVCQW